MRVGIIGAGFGALSVAAELGRRGHHDVRLWERADAIGGVWRDNTYPGAACDAPSPIYSFSWAPHPWTRRYAEQPEILEYLRAVADREGVSARTQFGREVTGAVWDEREQAWTVRFTDGSQERVDLLVPAVGQLSRPALPPVPGIEDFAGPSFHSAVWDHHADLTGRIAVIGTGASAIQFVPHLVEGAARVTVFQRTPNWILPKPDAEYASWYQPAVRAERPVLHGVSEVFSRGLDEGTAVAAINRRVALAHLARQVRDPDLRARLTPDYPIGCKRILFSNAWYPAIADPRCTLVTEGVERVTSTGVVHGGRETTVDAIVYGTGFDAQDFLDSLEIRGRDGRLLSEQWSAGARAYLGIHVPGFPNLMLSYGPNTNLGGGSILTMLEAQARHIGDVVDRMRSTGCVAAEVTHTADARWDNAVQARLARSAWNACDNWYRDPSSGRITSNWPGGTNPYTKATARLDDSAFYWTPTAAPGPDALSGGAVVSTIRDTVTDNRVSGRSQKS